MTTNYEIAVLPGDGIGPEIIEPTVKILDALAGDGRRYSLTFTEIQAGAAHYARSGESISASAMKSVRSADAILLAAMGLPDVRYPDGTEISPQIEIRKELSLFAGVRPVTVRAGQLGPLKLPKGKDIDFVLIRESTEGLFYSQGKGDVTDNEARETLLITRDVSEKLFRFAFELARNRRQTGRGRGHVTCVDKANVFRAFAFFRSIFDEIAQGFPDLESSHAYVDATALWMVQKPWDFDVLVTENMFGDILSDLGAGLMGGLGLAPSADIGVAHAVFQPCHGSAPDIAGKGVANPFAMVLSAAMMLEWLGHTKQDPELTKDANRLRQAVEDTVSQGVALTRDLGGTSSTTEAADAVLDALFVT